MALTVADLLVTLASDSAQFEKDMNKVTERVAGVSERMVAVGKKMSLGFTLPLAGIGAVALKMAADFDSAMTRIVSLVGIAREQVDAWRKDVRAIAGATAQSSTELAEALFFITSAGLRGTEAMDALRASAQAAAIGLGETKTIAFAVVSSMNAYKKSGLEAEQATAILVKTVREGNLEAGSLAGTFGRILPVAAAMGVEMHELGAAYASMTRLGVSAEEAATSLRGILASMMKPTKEAQDAMTAMGYSFDELRGILREKGLLNLLFMLRDMIEKNGDQMSVVFGNVRALTGVLNLVGENAAATEKIFASLATTTKDDLALALEEAEKAWKHRLSVAMTQMKGGFMDLGERILPLVVPAMEQFGSTVKALRTTITDLPPLVQGTAVALGGLLFAAGPVTGTIGKMIGLFEKVRMSSLGFALASTQLTDRVTIAHKALGSMTMTLPTLATSVGVVGAAFAGWMIGRFISDVTGLSKAVAEAGPPLKEMAEALEGNKELFNETATALGALAGKLGEAGIASAIAQAQARGDAKALAYWQDQLLKMAHEGVAVHTAARKERERATAAAEDQLTAEEQVYAALERTQAAQQKATDDLLATSREEMLTQDQVKQRIVAQIEAMQALQLEGYSMNQIVAAHGSDLQKNLDIAKDYGVALPVGAQNLVEVLQKQGHPELAKAIAAFDTMQQTINVMGGKLIEGFAAGTEGLEDGLAGGFGRGIEKGIAYGDQALQSWVEEVSGREVPISIVIDDAKLRQWIDDLVNGRLPPDGGRSP